MKTTIICDQCHNPFQKDVKFIKHKKARGDQHFFCSIQCVGKFQSKSQALVCQICKTPFTRKMAEIRKSKSGNMFCSHSCAATSRNTNYKKTKNVERLKQLCQSCGKPAGCKAKRCSMCARIEKLNGKLYDATKGELFGNLKWQNARSCIQRHARRTFWLSGRTKECYACKYRTHI